MLLMGVLHYCGKPIEIWVRWLDNTVTSYDPTDDLLTMFDQLCDHLAYDPDYRVCIAPVCKPYEDSDYFSVILINHKAVNNG